MASIYARMFSQMERDLWHQARPARPRGWAPGEGLPIVLRDHEPLTEETRARVQAALDPFRQTDLEPFYRELDKQIWHLSRQTKTPYSLLTNRPRPSLRDRLWSRLRAGSGLLLGLFRR